ncbi:MAG: rhomboid family intramembrane serine protease [Bacteroidota bacterium]
MRFLLSQYFFRSVSFIGVLVAFYFLYLSLVLFGIENHELINWFNRFFLFVQDNKEVTSGFVSYVTYSFMHLNLLDLFFHSLLLFFLVGSIKSEVTFLWIIWILSAILGAVFFQFTDEPGVLIGPSVVICVFGVMSFFAINGRGGFFSWIGAVIFILFFSLDTTLNGFNSSFKFHVFGMSLGLVISLVAYRSKMNWFDRLKLKFGFAPELKVKQQNPRFKSDEEFNEERKMKRAYLDLILEKISRSGYESLSKTEKKFLEENRIQDGEE